MLNGDLLTEFDKELWISTIEIVTVYDDRWVFEFKDGLEIEWVI